MTEAKHHVPARPSIWAVVVAWMLAVPRTFRAAQLYLEAQGARPVREVIGRPVARALRALLVTPVLRLVRTGRAAEPKAVAGLAVVAVPAAEMTRPVVVLPASAVAATVAAGSVRATLARRVRVFLAAPAMQAVRALVAPVPRAVRTLVAPARAYRFRPLPGLLSLMLVFAAAMALLVAPGPAGRIFGHRLAGSSTAGRPQAGAQNAKPVGTKGGAPAAGSTAQPAKPGRPSGTPTTPQASGPVSPSASASPSDPPGTVFGAVRKTGTGAVALTFDDGPDPVQTPALLDLLKEQGIKATFCMVGFRVRDHPDLVKRIAAEGHTLCNHSWQHLINLAKRPPDYIRWDLESTNNAIRAAVPDAKISYFRAPGGNFTRDLVAYAKQLGMESIYWDVDPRDWDHTKDGSDASHIDRVIGSVQHNTRPGSIVLSHDNGQPDTIAAYRVLIPWLKERFPLEALPTA